MQQPPWEDKQLMTDARRALQSRASKRGYFTYRELGSRIGLDMASPRDRAWMSGLLGRIPRPTSNAAGR
jgi:hypothetical protein